MLCVRPLAISQLLNLSGFEAIDLKVIARYAQGLVVKIPTADQSQTIFVSTYKKGLLPRHIIIREKDFRKIHSESSFNIKTVGVKSFSLSAPNMPIDRAALSQNLSLLDAFLSKEVSGLGDLTALYDQLPLAKMALSYPDGTNDDWEKAVTWLMGRGPGSTPTGDDLLMGALCVQYVLGQENSPLWNYLNKNKLLFNSLTTPLSAQYFESAINGFFPSRLLQVVNALLSKQQSLPRYLNNMKNIGAHSGVDGLFGIFITSQSIIKHLYNRGGSHANCI